MSDQTSLWMWVHRANIERYQHMMKTPLTPSQRRFIAQRIVEEEDALRNAEAIVAVHAADGHP